MSSIRVMPPYFTTSLRFISQPKSEPSISIITKTIDLCLSSSLSLVLLLPLKLFSPQNSRLSQVFLILLTIFFFFFFPQDDRPLTPTCSAARLIATTRGDRATQRSRDRDREREEIRRRRRPLFGDLWYFFMVIFAPFGWSPELVIFGPFCR
jgi:hypothetical protein